MNKLIMMIGIPGSGKSTYAKQIVEKENAIILSCDELRKELWNDENDIDHNEETFKELYRRVNKYLTEGKNVILDSTNINYKRRMGVLSQFKNYIKDCYIIVTPYEKCLEQNNKRDRKVPGEVIKKMYKNIYVPQYFEGWDNINIIYNVDNMKFDTHELFNGENGLNTIDQNNQHHTLTIGKHCSKCMQICEDIKFNFCLSIAALYHDIGKKFTKEFKNKKDEITNEAHYYQHHLVSAYDTLFYLKRFDLEHYKILEIIQYITWHMQPFNLVTEKSKQKFINLVGKEFYENLMILHLADIMAK